MAILNGKTAVVTGSTSCIGLPSSEHDGGPSHCLAGALGLAEAPFSEDVLPCDAELMAPADFYAALASGPRRTRTTATAERIRFFPCLAA